MVRTNGLRKVFLMTTSSTLTGSLDTQHLSRAADEHLSGKVINWAVDLAGIRYINSSGIGVLISLLTTFRSRGGEMVLTNPADYPAKMLAFTKLNNIFTAATDEITARQQLAAA